MTTPVDPRPYAGPTDLVTAADVARWLDDRAMASPPEPVPQYSRHWTLELAWADLRARLDRERRQACRRGCFAMFADACLQRKWERESRKRREEGANTDTRSGVPYEDICRERRRYLTCRALAFRAAAKPPKETP